MFRYFSKNAISPVVATALLLVVSVSAVVGFSNWFNTFSSSTLADVETQSSFGNNIKIEAIVGTDLYIKSSSNSQKNVLSLTINGINCTIDNSSFSSGLDKLQITGCDSQIDKGFVEVLVQTDDDLITSYVNLKNSITPAVPVTLIPFGMKLIMNNCPINWVEVGNLPRGLGSYQCDGQDCKICESQGFGIEVGTLVLMQNCPVDWIENSILMNGLTPLDCGGQDCKLCEVTSTFIPQNTNVVSETCVGNFLDTGFSIPEGLGSLQCDTESCKICSLQ